MKKITSLLLCLAMLVTVCLAAVSCNRSEKPKSAEELFSEIYVPSISENIVKAMGISGEFEKFSQNTKNDGNFKTSVSASLSKLDFSGISIIESPVTLKESIINDANGKQSSFEATYNYLTDEIKMLAYSDGEKILMKFVDITDKYIDISTLLGFVSTDSAILGNVTEMIPDAISDMANIIASSIDLSKLTETEKEITVNGITEKVRAIELTFVGDEIASILEKTASGMVNSKAITELCELLDIDLTPPTKEDMDIGANDKISLVRYFSVNDPKGFELVLSAENGGEITDLSVSYTELADENGIYGSLVIKASDDEDTVASIKGSLKSKSDVFGASIDVEAEGNSLNMGINGTVASNDDGSKKTNITLSVSMSGVTVSIPVVLTYKETADKDKASVSIDMSVSALSMIDISCSFSATVEHTDEKVVTVPETEITDLQTAFEGSEEKLMTKFSNTLELLENLDDIFGFGGDSYPDWDDEDWDYEDWDYEDWDYEGLDD